MKEPIWIHPPGSAAACSICHAVVPCVVSSVGNETLNMPVWKFHRGTLRLLQNPSWTLVKCAGSAGTPRLFLWLPVCELLCKGCWSAGRCMANLCNGARVCVGFWLEEGGLKTSFTNRLTCVETGCTDVVISFPLQQTWLNRLCLLSAIKRFARVCRALCKSQLVPYW